MMRQKILLPLLALTLLSVPAIHAGQGNPAKAQKMAKQGKPASPFLISRGLPHMTKLVKQNWDNPALGLSDEQKEKLLVVRKSTLSGVKAVKPQVMKLEKKIRKMTMQGVDTATLEPMIEKLADLKAQATKVHVRCIHDTKNILTAQQLSFLLKR